MTPSTIEKIINIALHPSTNEEEATAAFRHLHRNASKFGGLSMMLGNSGIDLRKHLMRAESEAVELKEKLSVLGGRFRDLEAKYRDMARKVKDSFDKANNAEELLILRDKQITALENDLAKLNINGKSDELGIISQNHAQIESLVIKLKAANHALCAAEANRDKFAAEKVAEICRKMRAVLDDEDGPASTTQTNTEKPPREPAAKRSNKRAESNKSAASAPNRARAQPAYTRRKGADTERLVLDLLTFEWKSVNVLFRAAQRLGFAGVENAIRFAAERLVEAGNATQGNNSEGRIAFRRA